VRPSRLVAVFSEKYPIAPGTKTIATTWTAQTLRGNKRLILEITLMVVFTVVALGDVEH
jgi:hypothetical protein